MMLAPPWYNDFILALLALDNTLAPRLDYDVNTAKMWLTVRDVPRYAVQQWCVDNLPVNDPASAAESVYNFFQCKRKDHPESYATCACHVGNGIPRPSGVGQATAKKCTCGVKFTGGICSDWCDLNG